MAPMPLEKPEPSDPRLKLLVPVILWAAAFGVGTYTHRTGLAVALLIAGCVVGVHILEGRSWSSLPTTFVRGTREFVTGTLFLLALILLNVVMNGVLFVTVLIFSAWFVGAILFLIGRWVYQHLRGPQSGH